MASERSFSPRRPGIFAVLALAGLLLQRPAFAEPSAADKETARNLLKEGDDKLAAKDFAGALKAYSAAHAIMQLPSTGLPLAKAQIEKGLLVEARDTLLQVSRLPKDPNEKPAQTQARDEAAQLAGKIADRIPSVQVSVEGPSSGTQVDVTIDGVAILAATLGTPRKVNPGQHVIVASASGFQTLNKSVTLKEGESQKVVLELKPGASGAQGAAIQGGGTIHVESPSVPGNVIVDGKAVGATPLDVPVTAGVHKVEIEYPGGSSDKQNVDIAVGATAKLTFSPSQLDAVARHRKGVHFGFAVSPTMLIFTEGGPVPLFGGAGSFVFNVGITPLIEFRSGLTAAFLYRGDPFGASQLTAVVPAMIRINYTTWFSASAGLAGGFASTFGENQTGGAIGPEWSIFSMSAGDKRQYELAFTQGLRFGSSPTEYHQSLTFTYLMLE